MAVKSKYQLMKSSEVTDSQGNFYPDLATFPLESFVASIKPTSYKMTYNDTLRFFDLIYKFYDSFNFYDDIILWLNDIAYISDTNTNFGKHLQLFAKQDLDDWYIASLRGETVEIEKRIEAQDE